MRRILGLCEADERVQARSPDPSCILRHEGIDAVLVRSPERPRRDRIGQLNKELAILEKKTIYYYPYILLFYY